MKKTFLVLGLSLILMTASRVAAQDRQAQANARTEAMQERVEEREQKRLELRQEFEAKRTEFRSQLAARHAERISKRFDFYKTRLEGIITRFQTRLTTLNESGIDTSTVQTKLDAASAALAAAATKSSGLVAAFMALDPESGTYKDDVIALRAEVKVATDAFKSVHTLLKEALVALKAINKPL